MERTGASEDLFLEIEASVTCVVIGNGAAGVSAALSIRRHDRESRVIILSDEEWPYYSRPLVVDVMTGKRSREEVTLLHEEEYRLQGLDLRKPVTVKGLDPQGKAVLTSAGTIPYDKLLIASGARPQTLAMTGEGIFYLRTLNDAESIHGRLQRGVKRALIYGAGPVGIKAGCALMEAGIPVSFIVTSQRILSRVLDRKSADHFQRLFEQRGARFFTGRQVGRLIRRKGFKGVMTDKGDEIEGDLLIVGKGVIPDVGWSREAGIEAGEGILVNDRMETSIADIYAAGDVAQARIAESNGKAVTAIWPLATLQGKIAGTNMAGLTVEYAGSVGSNSLDCFGTRAISMGIVEGEGHDEMILEEGDSYRKYVFDGERLTGAVLLGNIRNAGVLLNAIRKGLKVRGNSAMFQAEKDMSNARMEVLF